MEASKAAVHHIKQVVSDPQVVQINLVRHQCTDLPPSKHNKKQSFKSRLPSHKQYTSDQQLVPPYKKKFDPKQAHTSRDRWSKGGDSKHVEGFRCPAKKFQCKTCNKYGHFTSLSYKKQVSFKSRTPKAQQLQAEAVYMQEDSICSQSEDLTSSDESFCLEVRLQCVQASSKIPTTSYLITNLAYKLKPHHKRNQYLRARLDQCKHNACQCLQASLSWSRVAESCTQKDRDWHIYLQYSKIGWILCFYLVYPDTKCLQEVTFYVASNNGSVLLSCATTLALGLI